MRIFLAPILKFVFFGTKFFDWASIGGVKIFPLSLRLSGIEFSLV